MVKRTGFMMNRKRIYLSSPTMHGEEQKFVQEAFDTNWVAPLGPNVNAFEQEIAAYTGCGHAAALSAGTAAIHMALKLLHVERGGCGVCVGSDFFGILQPDHLRKRDTGVY